MTTTIFWTEFGVLFVGALIGAAAIVPYALRLVGTRQQKFSTPVLLLLTLVQSAILFGVATALGLWAAHAIGLGAPYLEALLAGTALPSIGGIGIAVMSGVIAGAVLLFADMLFEPYWPQAIRETTKRTTLSENFLASLYGGINEELLVRLFGFSVLAWLLALVWHTSSGAPTVGGLWIVNVIMTVLFGIGHLPALKQLLGTLPRLMVVRSLLLNAPVGLVCGWLFWTYGIEAAILAHFCADIVYHVIGTMVIRNRL